MTDLDALFGCTPLDRLFRHVTWQNEELKYLICPSVAAKLNVNVESSCQLVDLSQISIRKFMSKKVLNALQASLKIFQDYYPETLGCIYIVNAPALFSGLYSIIKGFMDERTKQKVVIMGSKYQEFLL